MQLTRLLFVLSVFCSAVVVATAADEPSPSPAEQIRVVPISLVWDEGNRTLEKTLAALDEAGQAGADLACLPQECVFQKARTDPRTRGRVQSPPRRPSTRCYVVGNLRETRR